MEYYGSQINKLIEELSRLPGIGAKSAQRLAFHIIGMPREQVDSLSSAIVNAKTNVRYCSCCCTLTDEELCPICSNPSRNHRVIMVVENTRDMAAYEKTQKYDGVYHVLQDADLREALHIGLKPDGPGGGGGEKGCSAPFQKSEGGAVGLAPRAEISRGLPDVDGLRLC